MKVKILIASLIVTCFMVNVSYAGVGLGIDFKGGLNLAKLRGDDVKDLEDMGLDIKMRPGAVAGLGLGVVIADMFVIQPEFLFAMKGIKSEMEESGMSLTSTFRLNYLEIPLLLKFNIPAGDVLIPNVYVGPALAINLSAKVTNEADPEELLQLSGLDDEIDMKDDTKAVDFGLAMGGGLDIKAGPGRVIIDIRYTLGFLIIDDTETEADMKNGALSFIVGYGIDIGG